MEHNGPSVGRLSVGDARSAHGIEVGAYDLIGWTRNPASINASWSCVDPATGKQTGNAFWGKGWSRWLLEQLVVLHEKIRIRAQIACIRRDAAEVPAAAAANGLVCARAAS